jgi:hypothetical protein
MIYKTWLKWHQYREPLLKALEQCHGSHTEDDVLVRLASGEYKLWTWEGSALVTYFVDYPQFKAINMFIYGGDLVELATKQCEVETWAAKHGAKRAVAGGREGWGKMFPDYVKHATMYYKDL